MRALFTENVCKNESLGSHGGRGGMDLQCGHFSSKMYAKTKELGPVGGACAPRSANVSHLYNTMRDHISRFFDFDLRQVAYIQIFLSLLSEQRERFDPGNKIETMGSVSLSQSKHHCKKV